MYCKFVSDFILLLGFWNRCDVSGYNDTAA